jgi:crotonobetainyl-CoA:carnitine CoA-transferase CaiB-like acyl-CoA transferase
MGAEGKKVAPLDGVRVVSLAGQYPGPYATLLLGDLGAEIIVVERPGEGDPVRAFPGFFAAVNRDKASVVIDLKAPEGREAFLALAASADVVIDGFRPGVLERLGVGFASLRTHNPELITVSATGYGRNGPMAMRSGHDLTYRAEAGMLSIDDSIDRSSLPIADVLGAHAIVESVLLGLLTRGWRTSCMDFDVSIFDTLISALSIYLEPLWNGDGAGGFPAEPGYDTFRTADNELIALGIAHEDKFWRALCEILELRQERKLDRDQRFARREELNGSIARAVGSFESPALEARLLANDVPFGRVRRTGELANHPQVVARGLAAVTDEGKRHYVPQPLVVDARRPTKGHHVAPTLGAHTTEILSALQPASAPASRSPVTTEFAEPQRPPQIHNSVMKGQLQRRGITHER